MELLNIIVLGFSLVSMITFSVFIIKTSGYKEETEEVESLFNKQYESLSLHIQNKQKSKLNKSK